MLRRNITHHQREQFQNIPVFHQTSSPRHIVHVANFDFDLPAKGKQFAFALIVRIKLVFHVADVGQAQRITCVFIIGVDALNCIVNQSKNPLQGQVERIDRAFHPLHQVNSGQATDALFTVCLCETDIDFIVLIKFRVLFYFAALNKVRWSIDG